MVRGLASANRVRWSRHSRERMAQRGMTESDVLLALRGAVTCQPGNTPDRWKVTGPDTDGDDLTAVVRIEGDLLVITVY